MGNIFSVSLSGNAIVSGCWDSIKRRVEYVHKLEDNHGALVTSFKELTAMRDDVKTKVEEAGQKPFMKRLKEVDNWISSVEKIENDVNGVLNDRNQEIEKLCCGGFCSTHYKSSYSFGKQVAKLLQRVTDLKSKGGFKEVAAPLPAPAVKERPVEPTVGMESKLDEVWRSIEDDQVGIIGIYGMGGVGKTHLLLKINNDFATTLLSEINKKLANTRNDFSPVIWVVVSNDLKYESIQKKIGEQIGFPDVWNQKEQDEKAEDIFRVLSEKKFVLLLDDIWEQVDITKLGIPIPSNPNKCKLIFTTRSKDVCGLMDAHKVIKVECLAWDEAWELFQQKVGKETIFNIKYPEIRELAETVAKECDGLPLALTTVGRAMASKKTPEEWKRAIQVLKKFPAKISGMGDKVFHLLKFSYDNLSSEKVKSCFLYCALFPEDFLIPKDHLLYCWMCEGILDEYANVDEAKNESYDIIGTLLNACLLEPVDEECVKMHDVTRDMALWLACDPEKTNKNFLVHTNANLIEAPNVEKWKSAERVSLINNHIEHLDKIPECPNLLTLFLQANKLKKVVDSFFDSMRSLQVLDFSENVELTELPFGVSKLVSLQYLSLLGTGIRELPTELKALVKLKYLNLEHTQKLEFVPPHIISSFSRLKVLMMWDCGVNDKCPFDSEKAMLDELQCLKHLEVLALNIRSTSCFEQLLSYHNLVTSTRHLILKVSDNTRFLDISSSPANMKHLDCLQLVRCTDLEELKVNCKARGPNDPRDSMTINQICFNGVTHVHVAGCTKLKDLTWLIFAQNLMILGVLTCDEMEKIINFESLGGVANLVKELNPFAKLKHLALHNLPKLQSIYENALPFPYLEEVYISDCPALKKLPLDSRSTKGCNLFIEGEEEWWNGLEWEDPDARNVFRPFFRTRKY